jgi:hypothetical protein
MQLLGGRPYHTFNTALVHYSADLHGGSYEITIDIKE